MNKVVVVADASLRPLPLPKKTCASRKEQPSGFLPQQQQQQQQHDIRLHKYECWVPLDYSIAQLTQDVVHFWHLPPSKLYQLHAASTHKPLAGDWRLDFLSTRYEEDGDNSYDTSSGPATFTLRKAQRTSDDQCLLKSSSATRPATWTLDTATSPTLQSPIAATVGNTHQLNTVDPFWIQEKLFELFLFYALQNMTGKAPLWVTCYQFKSLLQKATNAKTFINSSNKSIATKRKKPSGRKLEFDTRVLLAFKGAVPNSSGGAGATFDEFLDALVDVASFMFPKLSSSKELAFEKLATKFVIPQYERERHSGGASSLSWTQMNALLATQSVNALIARFAKPVGDLAASFSSTIGGACCYRGLQFHEFTKFVFDIKPKSFAVNCNELCDVFIRCCCIELREQYSDTTTLASLYFSTSASSHSTNRNGSNSSSSTLSSTSSLDGRSKSMPRRTGNAGGNFTTHGGSTSSSSAMIECGGALEIQCGKMMSVFAYLALITMPPLAKMKDQLHKANFAAMPQLTTNSSNLTALSVKAFLHHIANHLSTKNAGHAKKCDAAFALARVHFLHEFHKMHQEDAMADYLSELAHEIRALLIKHEALAREAVKKAQINAVHDERGLENGDESSASQESLMSDEGFDLSLDWGNCDGDVDEDTEDDDEMTSEVDSTDDRLLTSIDPELLRAMRERELEELAAVLNEGDEIYSFLASELQRHALLDKRIDDTDTVSQMLDMWVAAGQKYAQVISHVEGMTKNPTASEVPSVKVAFLQRFGCSLFVLARQLLTSTTKVYAYEEFFSVTNARVYGVHGAFWDDSGSVFTTDLAMETLSLASGKLTLACAKYIDELSLRLDGDGSKGSSLRIHVGNDHADLGDGDSTESSSDTSATTYEKYLECLFHRAACLGAYGDLLAHNTRCVRDYELGCLLEEELEGNLTGGRATPVANPRWEEYHSVSVLSKASSPGQFYREAGRICRFVSIHSPQSTTRCPLFRVHHELSMTQFKLATHLPRGCVAEKKLLEEALVNLAICLELQRSSTQQAELGTLSQKKEYISAILVLRHKFFQPEGPPNSSSAKQQQQCSLDEDLIAPFYRFVLAAAFRDFDEAKTGVLTQQNLSQLNKACGRGEVSESAMQWLLLNFDHQGNALTERGLLQYFCWIAEADPLAFCEILDIFTSKYTETHHASITTSRPSHVSREPKAKSLRSILFVERRQQTATSTAKERPAVSGKKGIAECVVVLSGKMIAETCGDLSQTRSPSDIRLEPEVVDVLPSNASLPDELSKFCFPDDVFLYTEPLPPKTFDIVLTDIRGDRLYGSCLHFYEEKDPMDVLALISNVQKGRTASLPSWISLRDIQQHKTQWRCFVPKCLCVLSSHPLFQTFRDFLAQLYRLSMSGRGGATMLESFIFNLVEEIPLPASNLAQTSFRLVDRACLLTGNAPGLPALYPTEVDFTILFQCLSPENILKVYAFLLTEKKVVVCSSNYSIISPVTETLRALLHPFECQVVYIPVLPLSLLDFVSAPVPFFMGVRSDKRVESLVSEGIVVVDLDKSEVLLPPNELMPSLPDVKAKKLLQALRKVSYWASNQKSKDHFGRFQAGELSPFTASFDQHDRLDSDISQLVRRHDELTEKWSELQALFSNFATRLLKDFRKYCSKVPPTPAGSDETITFDKRGFLNMHPSLREFCTQLFQTQLFQRFIERSALDGATSGVEQEVSWLSARSKSVIWKSEPTEDAAAKAPSRQIVRVPSPFNANREGPHRTQSSQRGASLSAVDAFPMFNANAYEELLSRTTTTAAGSRVNSNSPRILTSPVSSKASLSFHNSDSPASKLVSAARQRLEVPALD